MSDTFQRDWWAETRAARGKWNGPWRRGAELALVVVLLAIHIVSISLAATLLRTERTGVAFALFWSVTSLLVVMYGAFARRLYPRIYSHEAAAGLKTGMAIMWLLFFSFFFLDKQQDAKSAPTKHALHAMMFLMFFLFALSSAFALYPPLRIESPAAYPPTNQPGPAV